MKRTLRSRKQNLPDPKDEEPPPKKTRPPKKVKDPSTTDLGNNLKKTNTAKKNKDSSNSKLKKTQKIEDSSDSNLKKTNTEDFRESDTEQSKEPTSPDTKKSGKTIVHFSSDLEETKSAKGTKTSGKTKSSKKIEVSSESNLKKTEDSTVGDLEETKSSVQDTKPSDKTKASKKIEVSSESNLKKTEHSNDSDLEETKETRSAKDTKTSGKTKSSKKIEVSNESNLKKTEDSIDNDLEELKETKSPNKRIIDSSDSDLEETKLPAKDTKTSGMTKSGKKIKVSSKSNLKKTEDSSDSDLEETEESKSSAKDTQTSGQTKSSKIEVSSESNLKKTEDSSDIEEVGETKSPGKRIIDSSDSDLEPSKETKSPVKRFKESDKQKTNPKVIVESSSDSESDLESYLKPADQIDLKSPFFDVRKKDDIVPTVGSDKSSVKPVEIQSLETTNFTFQEMEVYTKLIEETKKSVALYEAKKKNYEDGSIDVGKILKAGENLADTLHASDFESGDSDNDWEEVKEEKNAVEEVVPKKGVEITLEMPDAVRKKKGVDLMAAMKRRLNKIRKENQVLVHKVHLLTWIAHGNYVNNCVNDSTVLGMALSLLPSDKCYPAKRIDLEYLEQILRWYKKVVKVSNKPKSGGNLELVEALKEQIGNKEANNSKMLCLIFIAVLRALGLQCRLVLSLQVEPLRPPASELHSLSTKTTEGARKSQKVSKPVTVVKTNRVSHLERSKLHTSIKETKPRKSNTQKSKIEKPKTKIEKPKTKIENPKKEEKEKVVKAKSKKEIIKVKLPERKRKKPTIEQTDGTTDDSFDNINVRELIIKVAKMNIEKLIADRKLMVNKKLGHVKKRPHKKSIIKIKWPNKRREKRDLQLVESLMKDCGIQRQPKSKIKLERPKTSTPLKKSPKTFTVPEPVSDSEDYNDSLIKIQVEYEKNSDGSGDKIDVFLDTSNDLVIPQWDGGADSSGNEDEDQFCQKITENGHKEDEIAVIKEDEKIEDTSEISHKKDEVTVIKEDEKIGANCPQITEEKIVDSPEISEISHKKEEDKNANIISLPLQVEFPTLTPQENQLTKLSPIKDIVINLTRLNIERYLASRKLVVKLKRFDFKKYLQRRKMYLRRKLKKQQLKREQEKVAQKKKTPVKKNIIKIKWTVRHKKGVPQVDGHFDSDSDSDDELHPIQVDGGNDNKTKKKPNLRKLKKLPLKVLQENDSEEEFSPRKPFSPKNTPQRPNLKKLSPLPSTSKTLDVRNDIISLIKGRVAEQKQITRSRMVKKPLKKQESESDSDYAPEEMQKKKRESEDEFAPKTKVKKRIDVKKVRAEAENPTKKEKTKKQGNDVWCEVFLDAEEKWISVDVIFGQVHCVNEIFSRATQPVCYVLAWNNTQNIKDITSRYCENFTTITRKLRVDPQWWENTLKPYKGKQTIRDEEEDDELRRYQLEKPLPKTIDAYKNHPLYALARHLLKFEAIYPPDAPTLGFIRGEPVYSRNCVYTLHSRDIWLKQAKVVKLGEKPYKIVKARPKYDKLSNKMITDQLLEIFGEWQVQDYEPPTAENGIVPRNAFGNVDLFKPCMLPKGCVHLKLPGLNKVARRMNIDCASAIIGFDFHGGWSHPMYDGFVVCQEFEDQLIAAWELEQEELDRKEEEKIEKRVYGNWKRLIKGLLIREKLKAKYDFGPLPEPKPQKKKKT